MGQQVLEQKKHWQYQLEILKKKDERKSRGEKNNGIKRKRSSNCEATEPKGRQQQQKSSKKKRFSTETQSKVTVREEEIQVNKRNMCETRMRTWGTQYNELLKIYRKFGHCDVERAMKQQQEDNGKKEWKQEQ